MNPLLKVNQISDHRGHLCVIEGNKDVPFEIKRVFYIYGASEEKRGAHAHYKTRQVLISVAGECKVEVNDLVSLRSIHLDSPTKGLLLEPNEWHEMHSFSENCVLLVLASHHYDPQDYIRDFEQFVEVYKK